MSGSSRAKRATGKPFQKGDDPRRGKNGAACAERAAWANLFENALARKLRPEKAAEIIIRAFKARQSWAVQEVLDRLMGKVTQPVGLQNTGPDNALIIKVVHTRNGSGGNGDGGNGDKG